MYLFNALMWGLAGVNLRFLSGVSFKLSRDVIHSHIYVVANHVFFVDTKHIKNLL